jgi:hypothetical protein
MDHLPNRTTISGWVSDYEDTYGDNSFRDRGHKAPGGAVTYDLEDINELLRFKGYEPLQPPQPKVEVVYEPQEGAAVPMPGDIVFNPSQMLGITNGVSISIETFDAIAEIFEVAKNVVDSTAQNNDEQFLAFSRSKRNAERRLNEYKEAKIVATVRAHTTELLKKQILEEAIEISNEVNALKGGDMSNLDDTKS